MITTIVLYIWSKDWREEWRLLGRKPDYQNSTVYFCIFCLLIAFVTDIGIIRILFK